MFKSIFTHRAVTFSLSYLVGDKCHSPRHFCCQKNPELLKFKKQHFAAIFLIGKIVPKPIAWNNCLVIYSSTMENKLFVRKSHPDPNIRFGLFAKKNIKPGTVILPEAPLYKAEGTIADEEAAVDALSPTERILFDGLCGNCRCNNRPCEETAITRTWNSNSFAIAKVKEYSGLFYIASHSNHCCLPNCSWDISVKGWIVVRAVQKIERGDETTISYFGATGSAEERRKLCENNWGFCCACEACSSGADTSENFLQMWMYGRKMSK